MKTINSFPTFVLLLGALLVVTDATASAILPELDGNAAAQTNFRFIANATWSTEEAVSAMHDQQPK